MTTNTMMTENPMTTTHTDNAVRITGAVIGLGLLFSVVAGYFSPSLMFGISLAGGCLMFSSLISKKSVFGCMAALAIMGLLALTSVSIAPATVAIISLASIAIVAAGLVGFQLPSAHKDAPQMTAVNAHISKVDHVDSAANDDNRLAA